MSPKTAYIVSGKSFKDGKALTFHKCSYGSVAIFIT